MISLATLPLSSAQEVFDQGALHLLTQNKKCHQVSKNGWGSTSDVCMYRFEGLKCVGGCFISDEEYDPSMEENTWKDLIRAERVPKDHDNLITILQNIHDNKPVEDWKKELAALGLSLNLRVDMVNNFVQS